MGTVRLELSNERTGYRIVHMADDLKKIALQAYLHVLLKYVSKKPVKELKRMIEAHVMDSLAHIIATEAALLKADPETVGEVCYKFSMHRDTQMTHCEDAETKDDQKLKVGCRSKA